MSRKPRIHVPGGVYHVMLRGNGGREIFLESGDGARFLALLADGAERFGLRCHGYCLMPNHAHLVLQAGAAPLSRAMQNLAFRYTRHINAREQRIGHLFQGRYKAILVDADSYLLELVRYVHLNPVRAGLCDRPEAWRWSGHRAYLGRAAAPWLTTEWVLSLLAPKAGDARAAYRAFVADGTGEGRRAEFHSGSGGGGRLLGDDSFVERVLEQAGAAPDNPPSLEAIVAAVASAYDVDAAALAGPSRARLCAEARGLAGLVARETGAAPFTEVAARFGRDLSSLSRAVRRVEDAAADDDLRARRQAVYNAIMQA
ncbi:MAG: transposase [Alphaproteobacteria bacterium]|nr:transposase [Alphaproteobacteria bacterium]